MVSNVEVVLMVFAVSLTHSASRQYHINTEQQHGFVGVSRAPSVWPASPPGPRSPSSGWTAAPRSQPATECSSATEAPISLFSTWPATTRDRSGATCPMASLMESASQWILSSNVSSWQRLINNPELNRLCLFSLDLHQIANTYKYQSPKYAWLFFIKIH